MTEKKLTHFDENGDPSMVDISKKKSTPRVAIAIGKITMKSETLNNILNMKIKKRGNE